MFDQNNDIQFSREPVKYSVISISVALYVPKCVAKSIYTFYCSLPREMLKPGMQIQVVNVMHLSLN